MSGKRTFNALNGFRAETWLSNNGNDYGFSVFEPKLLATDVMGDQDHTWPPPKGYRGDSGGSFALQQYRAYFAHNGPGELSSNPLGSLRYYRSGDISPVALPSGAQFPAAPVLSNGALYAWGATGFARTIPTKPEADIATMLGEFSIEGIPRDPRDMAERWRDTAARFRDSFRRSDPRRWMARARAGRRYANDVGGAHLAVAFTWFPFLSEVTNITNAYLDRARIIAQFERDSGRLVRRRIVLEDLQWGDPPVNLADSYGWPTGASYLWAGPGKLTRHDSYRRKTWFSAAYMYYVRFPGSGLLHARGSQIRNRLFGTDITPSMLWNIAPWSWLADYGTNIGDVMTNMSQFTRDNLVARHAYVMSEAIATREYRLRNLRPVKGPPIEAVLMLKSTTKRRARGNPYAFALTPEPLTARQTAILTALGLTRL